MNRELKKRLIWMTALVAVAILALTFPQTAAADDDDPPGRVARLNYIQGSVSFQPAGESDWVSAVTNRPITTGDRLWADNGSRAELHTGSATIRLDSGSGFSFLNLDDRTVQIQLTQGTLDIRVRRLGRNEIFEVDTPNQAFTILGPGRYRLQAGEDGNSTFVMVRSGEGEVTGGGEIFTLHAGESGTFTGTNSLSADIYNAGRNDDFDNWGEGRDRHEDRSQSARYVSHDVVGYEDLDDYGSWRSDPGYGNVWVPTRVSVGWAPYHDGHWAWISPWGWTWVDDAPWGYAPFHYGRWIVVGGSWGWVPGPREVAPVYAPALVVFIGGSQFSGRDSRDRGGRDGNVGWFPLGPREVYVPGYRASRGYVDRVNVSNTNVSVTNITVVYNNQTTNNINNTNITYVNRGAPGGVTAVSQSAFTGGQPVARAAVVVNSQQIASAPIVSRAEVAPTRNSVMGASSPGGNRVAQPPAAIANRSVVVKSAPPPPPVPFARQQTALAAHPGEPLARHEVETLRPANVAADHPNVRQAPPGKPATPNSTRPVADNPGQRDNAQPSNDRGNKPGAQNPGQPANVQPANTANQQGNPSRVPPAKMPMTPRDDRPPSTQPGNPAAGSRPGGQNPSQPVNAQPPNTANQQGNSPLGPPEKKPFTPRDDRPASAQPNNPQTGNPPLVTPEKMPMTPRVDRPPSAQANNPQSGNHHGTQDLGQPGNAQPANTANQPGSPPRVTPEKMPMTPRDDHPPSAQPNNPQSGNRRGAQDPGQPGNSKSSNTANQPVNPPHDAPDRKPTTPRENRSPSPSDNNNNPPDAANRRTRPSDSPEPPPPPAQPPDHRTGAQLPQPLKVEPALTPEKQPTPPLPPDEKERRRKQEEKPPQER
jgi:hypothetical protein